MLQAIPPPNVWCLILLLLFFGGGGRGRGFFASDTSLGREENEAHQLGTWYLFNTPTAYLLQGIG